MNGSMTGYGVATLAPLGKRRVPATASRRQFIVTNLSASNDQIYVYDKGGSVALVVFDQMAITIETEEEFTLFNPSGGSSVQYVLAEVFGSTKVSIVK